MRIRKHAKISPLVYAASSLKPGTVIQTHFCQLNQSPWDVLTFPPPDYSDPAAAPPPPPPPPSPPPPPPPPCQVDKDENFVVDGNFPEAHTSGPSIKFAPNSDSLEQNEDIEWNKNPGNRNIGSKNYTHCKKEMKGPVSCSEQKLKKRKSEKTVETRRPSRPKKPNPSSNPYEFYYYSGFGPSWGKIRGSATKVEAECYSSESSKDEVVAMELDDDKTAPETNAVYSDSSLSEMCNEAFDYVEDDEDEEEESKGEFVPNKKKARKLIKARSLKSLM